MKISDPIPLNLPPVDEMMADGAAIAAAAAAAAAGLAGSVSPLPSSSSSMPPEMVMQLIQVSSAFLVTLNSYLNSTREIDRRARRLRRSRMLLLMRLIHLREEKKQRAALSLAAQAAAPPPPPPPLPIPRVLRPPPSHKYVESLS